MDVYGKLISAIRLFNTQKCQINCEIQENKGNNLKHTKNKKQTQFPDYAYYV